MSKKSTPSSPALQKKIKKYLYKNINNTNYFRNPDDEDVCQSSE